MNQVVTKSLFLLNCTNILKITDDSDDNPLLLFQKTTIKFTK